MNNDTDQIFIVSIRLNIAKDSLINRKIYKFLAVINLNQITNWEESKGFSNWVSVTCDKLRNTQEADRFDFSFTSQNLQDLLGFQFMLLNTGKNIINNEKKFNKLNFKIEALK